MDPEITLCASAFGLAWSGPEVSREGRSHLVCLHCAFVLTLAFGSENLDFVSLFCSLLCGDPCVGEGTAVMWGLLSADVHL